jgi:hypothetical protein
VNRRRLGLSNVSVLRSNVRRGGVDVTPIMARAEKSRSVLSHLTFDSARCYASTPISECLGIDQRLFFRGFSHQEDYRLPESVHSHGY